MDTLSQLIFYFGGLYIASSLVCCASRGRTKNVHEKIAPGALLVPLGIIIGRYMWEWFAPFLAIIITLAASFILCTLFRYYIEVPLIKLCFRKKPRHKKDNADINNSQK